MAVSAPKSKAAGRGFHSHLLVTFHPRAGAREGRVRGSVDPLKFGAEVRNCIWRVRRTGVKVMAMATCLTLIHDRPRVCVHIQRNKDDMTCCGFRGEVKIRVSCDTVKLDF